LEFHGIKLEISLKQANFFRKLIANNVKSVQNFTIQRRFSVKAKQSIHIDFMDVDSFTLKKTNQFNSQRKTPWPLPMNI
jgi:hypothetical protein